MRTQYLITIRNYDGTVLHERKTYSSFDDALKLAVDLQEVYDADDFDIEDTEERRILS